MRKEEFLQLQEKYRNGTATEQERSVFLSLIDTYEKEFSSRLDEEMVDEQLQLLGDAATGELIYAAIQLNKSETAVVRKLSFVRRPWIKAAVAVALLLVSVAAWFVLRPGKEAKTIITAKQDIEIPAGKDGAILTLADGSQVLLDSIKNGVVTGKDGTKATVRNGVLVYENEGSQHAFNTMSTPRGRQFQVTLPDGTKVWLNAASFIRYPTEFDDNKREVEMTGEVYFEVARDTRRPFRVKVADRSEVDVLGTHFNVNAYEQESSLNTTLLEGIVRVKNIAGELMLKPGQQLQFSQQGNRVGMADIEKVMAWKNGNFNFNGMRLKEAMRQLERWYDVEVVYEGNVPDVELFGEMGRDISLNGMLQVLKDLDIHASIGEGRRLIITP